MQTRQLQTGTSKQKREQRAATREQCSGMYLHYSCCHHSTAPRSRCAALATMHVTAASGGGLWAWKHEDPIGARPARVRRSVDLWACGQEKHSPRVRAQTVMREDTASGSACRVLATDAMDALMSRSWCSSRDGRDRSTGGSTSSSAAGSFQHRGKHANTRTK